MAPPTEPILVVLYYAYPATVFLYFFITTLLAICTLQSFNKSKQSYAEGPNRWVVVGLLGTLVSTHIAQLIAIVSQSAAHGYWPEHDYVVVGQLSCVLVFGIQLSRLFDSPYPVWYPFIGSWVVALPFEIAIDSLVVTATVRGQLRSLEILNVVLDGIRCVILVALICLASFSRFIGRVTGGSDEERQSLLSKTNSTQPNGHQSTQANGNASNYGSTTQQNGDAHRETRWERRSREAREAMEKRLEAGGNWFRYAKGFMVWLSSC